MDDGDKQRPADGDSIIIDVGEHARNVAAGKNVKQVIHQHAPAPPIDVNEALAKLAELPLDEIPDVSSLPAGSHLPYAPNPYFTGRLDELKQLAAVLKGGESIAIGQPRIAGATGMGGIGKSQLAAAFAHRYGRYFLGGVAWISLADAGRVPAEVVNACLGLPGLPAAVVDMDLPDQVRAIRQAWQSDLPRLLIFDNCEEEELLAQWRPTTGAARVLVTSRRSHFDDSLGVLMLPLRTLPRFDSVALLRRFRPDLAVENPELTVFGGSRLVVEQFRLYKDGPRLLVSVENVAGKRV